MTDSSQRTASVDARCYIERFEFPLVSLKGNYGEDTLHSVTLQIVVDRDPKFHARTYVEIEHFDSLDYPDGVMNFEGEILGYSFVSKASGNYCVIQAIGTSQYQMTAKVPVVSDESPKMPNQILGTFSGSVKMKKSDSVLKALQTEPTTQNLWGFLGGLVHLYELCMGIHKGSKKLKGNSTFHGMAEERLNLLQMISGLSEDSSPSKLIRLGSANKWFKKILDSSGGQNVPSFFQLKASILRRVYYRSIFMGPSYYSEKRTVGRKMSKTLSSASIAGLRDEVNAALDYAMSLQDSVRGQITENSVIVEDFIPALLFTTWALVDAKMLKVLAKKKAKNPNARIPDVWGSTKAKLSKAESFAWEIEDYTNAIIDAKKGSVSDYQTAVQAATKNVGPLIDKYVQTMEEVKALLKDMNDFVDRSTYIKDVELVPRYNAEVLAPELFFNVPPACNVMFSDMYNSFSFTRNFAQEPSRLVMVCPRLSDNKMHFRKKSMSYVVAPNISGNVPKTILEDTLTGKYTLLPHEKFYGPNPVTISVSQALGLSEHKIPKDLLKQMDKMNDDKTFPFLQRVAHFEYMNRLIGSRSGTLSGRYWARLIPGMPMAIESKVGTEIYGKTRQLFTAKIKTISYQISQERTTAMSLSLSHIMEVRERDGMVVHRRMYKDGPNSGTAAAKLRDALGKGKLSALQMAAGLNEANSYADELAAKGKTDQSNAIKAKVSKANALVTKDVVKLGLDLTGATDNGGSTAPGNTPEPTNIPKEGLELATGEHGVYDWDHQDAQTPVAVAVSDIIKSLPGGGSTITKSSGKAFDELAWPPWLSDIYDPENVGEKVYKELWGVGSLYDLVKDDLTGDISVRSIVERFFSLRNEMTDPDLLRPIVTISQMCEFRPNATFTPGEIEDHKDFDPRDDRYANVLLALKALDAAHPHHGAFSEYDQRHVTEQRQKLQAAHLRVVETISASASLAAKQLELAGIVNEADS